MQEKWKYIKSRLTALRVWMMTRPFLSALIFIFIVWIVIATIEWRLEHKLEGHNINNFEDAIWWGIVTLLTVGYGDKFPVSTLGRIFAGILMVSGVVGIAVITAKISSYFLERALRERRGFVDAQTLKNHFIICGWKDEMSNFLLHILNSNNQMKAKDIVMLNNVADSEIEGLLAIPMLKDIKVIKGEFFHEVNLLRVAPDRARKILILADATPSSSGEIPTLTEADARTIMTAMTLNNIAKGTPVVAEILDSSMEQYLRLAHVNEIIYSRDYSRMLLAMASSGVGVTNVFHDLLDTHSPYFVATKDIPPEFLGKTYEHLQKRFHELFPADVVIGILENSGNSHVAKENALRKAQQTPNIQELVSNLQQVKSLRFNNPNFSPKSDYLIRDGVMVIVIENRRAEAHA